MGSRDFIEAVQALLDVGDRQVTFSNHNRFSNTYEHVIVRLINLPTGVGGAGGGAEASNNRVMFTVNGFGRGENDPARGKVKLETLACEALSRDQVKKYLRGKSAAPEKMAEYVANALNEIVRYVPPNFTHTR